MYIYDDAGLFDVEAGLSPDFDALWSDRCQDAITSLRRRISSGELGFASLPERDPIEIITWAEGRRAEGWTDQIVIGIGGSSLGTRAVLEAMGPAWRAAVRTHFAENLDPVTLHAILEQVDLQKTLLVVVTKSGSTIETMSQLWILYDALVKTVGRAQADRQVIAITDPQKGSLRALARERGWESFEVPANVGGRFSVLSPVSLVPLALAGYDVDGLLGGARRCLDGGDEAWMGLARIAAQHVALGDQGYGQLVMMAYGDRLNALIDWFRQLWAESLGKARDRRGARVNTGITPIKAIGAIDQHSQVQLYMEGPNDKQIVFVETRSHSIDLTIPASPPLPAPLSHLQGRSLSEILQAEAQGTRAALARAGRPTACWRLESTGAASVGGFLAAWMFITALAGELLDIDAFDQPGVELGKKIAHGLLGHPEHGALAGETVPPPGDDASDSWTARR
ncbi:glucose-6-phosphate isomerase [Lujinxingia sediminis]|uniref:Glucose-6-phosphate isomerase n=1 Tax=Lujinxingia sediminis TaxID=2480984 RepID=A0ABY0CYC3_9DELT|nr:glucose-6-phosphate isomerase [Lujinxingia sediminis]RVU48714.1 glucose-6-phosphate isomerase [Lujinxingia sediminis]